MVTQDMVTWLRNNQWSNFYQSLLTQHDQGRTLSAKQVQCILDGMDKQAQRAAAPKADFRFGASTLKVGALIEVKAWIARRLQADLNMEYFFRNLQVEAVERETTRAYQVKVSFVSKIVTSCHICGRDLDTDVSKACGIGPVCADRLGLPRPSLSTAAETLAAIDMLCKNLGTIGPIWVPKSQIKTITGGD